MVNLLLRSTKEIAYNSGCLQVPCVSDAIRDSISGFGRHLGMDDKCLDIMLPAVCLWHGNYRIYSCTSKTRV